MPGRGHGAGGLTVDKSGDDVTLVWQGSCAGSEDDYAVYEGTLGSFTSHTPRACSTGGTASHALTPSAGDTYYLVVPIHADREGSYGDERPPSTTACAPQQVRPCGASRTEI